MVPNIPSRINTSNKEKLSEFLRLFSKYGKKLTATTIDMPEIKATPLEVIVHKASNMEPGVLVEDTSLEIEGEDVGINIKGQLDHLKSFVGKEATWIVFLAFCHDGFIYVYEGKVVGKIVKKRGCQGFGFDAFFLPHKSKKTLGQEKPDHVNARALAVKSLFNGTPFARYPVFKEWNGAWQQQ